jgi:chromosomal replication initiation ATPase DnaA
MARQATIRCAGSECKRIAILGEFCHEHWRGRREQLYETYPELLPIRNIATVVANYYGYETDELLYNQNRSEVWNHMRQVAIVLIKDSTNVRDGEIGLVFDRLVSSITHARQSAARRMLSDPKFRFDVTEIWGILEEKNLIQEL